MRGAFEGIDGNDAVASVAYRVKRSHRHLSDYSGFGDGRAHLHGVTENGKLVGLLTLADIARDVGHHQGSRLAGCGKNAAQRRS